MRRGKLGKDFFARDAKTVAIGLLGKTVVRKINGRVMKSKIVETEAYLDENDPGSRARQNGDLRQTMMMPPGTILVYGVHNNWLVNFVTGKEGDAEAVLIRALEPLNFDSNCSGPGMLTKALSIDKTFHKKNVSENSDIWVEDDESSGVEIVPAYRIGLREDMKEKMRFYVKGNRFVSRK
jgi:DNA-3-methyladenine glycosylase